MRKVKDAIGGVILELTTLNPAYTQALKDSAVFFEDLKRLIRGTQTEFDGMFLTLVHGLKDFSTGRDEIFPPKFGFIPLPREGVKQIGEKETPQKESNQFIPPQGEAGRFQEFLGAELQDNAAREIAEKERLGRIQEGLGEALLLRALHQQEIEEMEGAHQERLGAIIQNNASLQINADRKMRDEKIRAAQNSFSAVSNIANALFIATGSRSKALFKITKAANIANTIMNTYAGATKAFVDPGGFAGKALAASIIAAGLANVARISQTTLGGGSVGGGGGGTSFPSVNTPSGFPNPQNQGRPPKIEIHVHTLHPSSLEGFDWEPVIAPIAEAFGNHVGRGGSTGDVELVVNVRGD